MTVWLEQDDTEHPVPVELRGVFEGIADAFMQGDYELRERPIAGVAPVDRDTAQFIEASIAAYGDVLAPLDPAVWERSCYAWAASGHWQVLVDLTTQQEPVSDLTLHADIRLEPLRITVRSVHVP